MKTHLRCYEYSSTNTWEWKRIYGVTGTRVPTSQNDKSFMVLRVIEYQHLRNALEHSKRILNGRNFRYFPVNQNFRWSAGVCVGRNSLLDEPGSRVRSSAKATRRFLWESGFIKTMSFILFFMHDHFEIVIAFFLISSHEIMMTIPWYWERIRDIQNDFMASIGKEMPLYVV